jgi:hypothetical protein
MLASELETLKLYKEVLLVQVAHQQSKTNLEEDMRILERKDLSNKMRAVVTYRAERKKILHS